MSDPKQKSRLSGTVRHRLMLVVDDFKQTEKKTLEKAITFAEEAHQKQFLRPTKEKPEKGEPYIVHPMRVALILLEEVEIKDVIAVASALLHDVIEAKRETISVSDIEREFGRPIAMLVSILTKPPMPPYIEERQRKSRGWLCITSELSKPRSWFVSLNWLTVDSLRSAPDWANRAEKETYLAETRDFYIPLAEKSDDYLHEELLAACEQLELDLKFN